MLLAAVFVAPYAAAAEEPAKPQQSTLQPTETETIFLDRLMLAESGGREDARNPRSTALGPFQFLASTFLDLMGRYFAEVIDGKTDAQVLQLRTDTQTARNAALLYTRENAAFLLDKGMEASAGNLRLAFLVGPTGAMRVIAAEPKTPVAQLLGASALEANPFMTRMTAEQLLQRTSDEAAGLRLVTVPQGRAGKPKFAGIRVRCNLARPSCRKWLSLANNRVARRAAAKSS